jgi:hypothetical protein
VVRHENGVRADGLDYAGANGDGAAPAFHLDEVSFRDAEFLREQRMDFAQRLGILVDQRSDAARLRSGKIVGDHATGGQDDGILGIRFFRCRTPLHRLKMGFAIRMVELVALIKPGCSWMIHRRTRPAHAVLPVDSVPGNAIVVADAAFGSDAQLIKYFLGGVKGEFAALTQAGSYIANNLPINPGMRGRINGFLVVDDSPFHVGRGSFIFFHQRSSQHHVTEASRL